jgi:hypothetical protein
MKQAQSWRTYTVANLFSRFNWEGTPPKPTATKKPSPPPKVNWKAWTVQEFFSRNNWEGQTKPKPVYSPRQKPTTLTLQLPVTEFFGHFIWEAQPQIGQLPNLETEASQTKTAQDLTLTDLSQLF